MVFPKLSLGMVLISSVSEKQGSYNYLVYQSTGESAMYLVEEEKMVWYCG